MFDKKHAAMGLALFAVVLGPLPIVLRLMDWFPQNGTRDLITALFFFTILLTAAIISINIITASMIADLTDQGEMDSGRRLEGAFSSLIVFSVKASSGLGALLAGITLDLIAFPRQDPQLAADSAQTLATAYAPAIMLLYAISLYFLNRYQLSRSQHSEVLATLANKAA